jgi:hypothetical protein
MDKIDTEKRKKMEKLVQGNGDDSVKAEPV